MRRNQAFTLVELMVVMALMAILLVSIWKYMPDIGKNSNETVARQQAIKAQEALSMWYARQSSSAAVAMFQAGPDGDLVPTSNAAMVAAINAYLAGNSESMITVNGAGQIVTESLTSLGGYLEIKWPVPTRTNYPRILVTIP